MILEISWSSQYLGCVIQEKKVINCQTVIMIMLWLSLALVNIDLQVLLGVSPENLLYQIIAVLFLISCELFLF